MTKKKLGRPRIRRPDLEQFTARLTPESKARLQALAQVSGEPGYSFLELGFQLYWDQLPDGLRQDVEQIVELTEKARKNRE